ncbi:MAG: Rne/Rng family ribonuclease [Acidobacteria bacterium]|nr:Rne/Rng family ribonuclease [Acidobacteriota bacterium]
MAKELIVSVNGREKKIAIIENERVTEFYIERGEENQGIVGNIYKGRVMRVLPGMQSAFVDIGLERDAFLYVSDFFDEEEEFERIVMDKSKKGDLASAEKAAHERIEQARIEREQRIEATQEKAEPLSEAALAPAEEDVEEMHAALEDDEPEEAAAVADVAEAEPAAPVQAEAAEVSDEGGRKRGRRGRRRGKGSERSDEETATGAAAPITAEEIDTPFAQAAGSFERVVDEDERAAAEEGEMFKDARLQERIFDQIHAVEFDIDDAATAEVGSLLGSAGAHGDASFQRIDDSDIAPSETPETAYVQETVAAHVGAFIDEIAEETVATRSFERISDDEKATEGGIEETPAAGKRARKGSRTKKEAAPAEEAEAEAAKPARGAKKGATKSAAKKPAAATRTGAKKSAAKSATKSKSKRTARTLSGEEGELDMAVLEGEHERAEHADLVAAEAADGEHFEGHAEEAYEDGEASISTKPTSGEFATRRGGRRRRRKPNEGEEERTNGKDEDAGVEDEEPAAPPAPAPRESRAPRDRESRSEREPRSDREPRESREREPREREPREQREQREPRERESRDSREPRERRERHSNARGGPRGGSGGRREPRQQPTITDLLREGQEILVQIAKEPIAKKGARITSHIALPGRYLVYMPTVEHVGVSRKIESDGERARLRKLIQAIRAEENVPSGGFIVRTAGIGVSEEGLREDARYLVRTWLDIRRSAEKAKAPSMAHQDLDLVQRILRDQLSDDFTAIRVDSEEEYQSIVEFINRIQPRMVKRVKLHTRDEPILETYGVQAEIDKAIKPRVWLKSGGYLVINQTEALVAIDVNTGKFVGRGGSRLEDTITRTNLEAVDEIVRQIRLRDLGGIIVLDLIDMEDRRNRNRVMQALQEALQGDKSPTKVLSFNDFGLVIMTRKRVKQSLERTLCAPCPYCQGAGLVKSPQTVCYEILEEARRLARGLDDGIKQTTLRVNPEVAKALRSTERDVFVEIEDYLGTVDVTSDTRVHQEQFDFAFI